MYFPIGYCIEQYCIPCGGSFESFVFGSPLSRLARATQATTFFSGITPEGSRYEFLRAALLKCSSGAYTTLGHPARPSQLTLHALPGYVRCDGGLYAALVGRTACGQMDMSGQGRPGRTRERIQWVVFYSVLQPKGHDDLHGDNAGGQTIYFGQTLEIDWEAVSILMERTTTLHHVHSGRILRYMSWPRPHKYPRVLFLPHLVSPGKSSWPSSTQPSLPFP